MNRADSVGWLTILGTVGYLLAQHLAEAVSVIGWPRVALAGVLLLLVMAALLVLCMLGGRGTNWNGGNHV